MRHLAVKDVGIMMVQLPSPNSHQQQRYMKKTELISTSTFAIQNFLKCYFITPGYKITTGANT